jgi:hypothetical protein
MTDKTQDLQQLISLSRTMLEKAREELWDEVFIMEMERSELLRLFFLETVEQAYTDTIADGIQAIMAINSDLVALGMLKRFELAQTLQTMDQGKKAVKAYTS